MAGGFTSGLLPCPASRDSSCAFSRWEHCPDPRPAEAPIVELALPAHGLAGLVHAVEVSGGNEVTGSGEVSGIGGVLPPLLVPCPLPLLSVAPSNARASLGALEATRQGGSLWLLLLSSRFRLSSLVLLCCTLAHESLGVHHRLGLG
jgi:hypothetical protein